MVEHNYGGEWTEKLKQKFLSEYLSFHTTALKNTGFNTVYIDAFCGTGTRVEEVETPLDLFNKKKVEKTEFDGSALLSLSLRNPFKNYHFIDINPDHLATLKAKVSKRKISGKIRYHEGDSNNIIPEIFAQYDPQCTRFVVFLDPYKTEVKFETLEFLSKTEVADVIYLFPWMAFFRNLSHDIKKRTAHTDKAILNMIGSQEFLDGIWEKKYIENLFENDLFHEVVRDELPVIQGKLMDRFNSFFAYVEEPIEIKCKGRPLFLLYLFVSNPSPKAVGLAQKGGRSIRKMVNEENAKAR